MYIYIYIYVCVCIRRIGNKHIQYSNLERARKNAKMFILNVQWYTHCKDVTSKNGGYKQVFHR